MVFFVCSKCGSSLKKNQVERHWVGRCRGDKHVSCMDCGKDFWNQEYAGHIKCITEDEKYGGSQYVAKEAKGEKKQEAWMAIIQNKVATTPSMDPGLKTLLNSITGYSNIPRKKKKFINFIQNSIPSSRRNLELINRAWDIFDEGKSQESSNTTGQNSDHNKKDQKEVPSEGQIDVDKAEVSNEGEPEKKKKKKKKKGKETEADMEVQESTDTVEHVEMKDNEENTAQGEKVTENGKLKKKNKKKEKLEEKVDPETHSNEDESKGKEEPKKKKKMKRKQSECMDSEENKKSKKQKKEDTEEVVVNGNHKVEAEEGGSESAPNSAFKWKAAFVKVLKASKKDKMKMTVFKKKVLALYMESGAGVKSEKELFALFNKKIKMKSEKYVVCNDVVKLKA